MNLTSHALLPVSALCIATAVSGSAMADPLESQLIPQGAVYVCVTGSGNDRIIEPIEMQANVASLCRRHTEMGPCQSARNACRASGGRVYGADGIEITQADEAEYDKRVTRVRVGP